MLALAVMASTVSGQSNRPFTLESSEEDAAAGARPPNERGNNRAQERVPLHVKVGPSKKDSKRGGDTSTSDEDTGDAIEVATTEADQTTTSQADPTTATSGDATTSDDETTATDESPATASEQTTSTTASDSTTTTAERADTTTTTAAPTTTTQPPTSSNKRQLLFYGMEWTSDPHDGDLEKAASLGIDTVMVDFDGSDPSRWLRQLDHARSLDLMVVANYWPGRAAWRWTGSDWDIHEHAVEFVETVADHPALLAVYLLHEPYWNGGDGITTAQQRELYQYVKSIADVPLYSAFSSSAFETGKFSTGVCDYCDSWYYPSKMDHPYKGERLLYKLEKVLNHFHATAAGTDMKLVWILQAFESADSNKEMPTYDEMIDLAETAINYQSASGQRVDAVFWYTWRHGSQYEEVLGDRPDLQPAVKEVHDRFVR